MGSIKQNAAHLIMATVVIAAVIVLTLHGNMNGETASAIIVGVGGFSLGGGVASSSAGAPVPGLVAAPASNGTSTLAPTTSVLASAGPSTSTSSPSDSSVV